MNSWGVSRSLPTSLHKHLEIKEESIKLLFSNLNPNTNLNTCILILTALIVTASPNIDTGPPSAPLLILNDTTAFGRSKSYLMILHTYETWRLYSRHVGGRKWMEMKVDTVHSWNDSLWNVSKALVLILCMCILVSLIHHLKCSIFCLTCALYFIP